MERESPGPRSSRPVEVCWRASRGERAFGHGVAHVLANGHTLITTLNQRRAVEVDGAAQEGWEYRSTDSRVTRNHADSLPGGGVFSLNGDLTVTRTEVDHNTSDQGGGGISRRPSASCCVPRSRPVPVRRPG